MDKAEWPTKESTAHVLPRGNGRSYGDSCQLPDGTLLRTRFLDRFLNFDPASGVMECEAGVLLADINQIAVPQGWFLPATPGTKFASVGGAIGNDVHGKNHHVFGSFGHHVLQMTMCRSDGTTLELSPSDSYFHATVGGLGMTGLITRATIQLRRIASPWMRTESIKFGNLDEFYSLSAASAENYEYTVAWIDCLAPDSQRGRGHFLRSDHCAGEIDLAHPKPNKRSFPFTPPISAVNKLTLAPFNKLYFHRQRARTVERFEHYDKYFYPLDGIANWNRMYGPRGFLQHQCVIPPEHSRDAIDEILRQIKKSGSGSFLAVLKEFGEKPSIGMLSFPRPGTTLALDFPVSSNTFSLLDRLDDVVGEAGGAIYAAKDARMSPSMFRQSNPRLEEFIQYRDPAISSGLWERLMENKT
ncbi:FAD-binding oxidoreductase [Luteimonas sp. SHGZ20W]